jgi:hypothetical protein
MMERLDEPHTQIPPPVVAPETKSTKPIGVSSKVADPHGPIAPDPHADFAANLERITATDEADRAKSSASWIEIGKNWYQWKHDEGLAGSRLADIAPKLRRNRDYLQRCLLFYVAHQTGAIKEIEDVTADYEPKSIAEPYRFGQRHAEYHRRIARQEPSRSAPSAGIARDQPAYVPIARLFGVSPL